MREPGSGTRAVNDEFLAEHELAVEQLTVGSNGAIKQAARAGLGISLMSRDAVADELDGGLLARIPVASAAGADVARDVVHDAARGAGSWTSSSRSPAAPEAGPSGGDRRGGGRGRLRSTPRAAPLRGHEHGGQHREHAEQRR